MASSSVYTALKNLLVATFAPTQVLDFDQIEPQLEQGKSTFLVLEEIYSNDEIAGFGDPTSVCMREISDVMVHVFTPSPESSNMARTFADNVRQQIMGQTPSGVRIRNVSPPSMELLNDGLWTSATLDVVAEYDRHVSMP